MRDEPKSREGAPNVDPAAAASPGGASAGRSRRLAAATALGGAIAFVLCALFVPSDSTDRLDAGVLRMLRRLDDPRLTIGGSLVADAARDFTALGGVPVLG